MADIKKQAEYNVVFDKDKSGAFKFIPRSLNRLLPIMKSLAAPIAVIGAAAVAIGVKAVASFKNQERVTNSLNQSLINVGIYTKELSQRYQEQAKALSQRTTFADEQIMEAQSQVQQFIGNTEVSEELTQSILDFAAGMNVDLKTAARLVGQSIGSSTNALSRYGIQIDATASKEEKLAAVVAGLGNKFGGQAEAQAQGLGGLKQMRNAFGNVMEAIGKGLAPAIIFFTKQLTAATIALQESTTFTRTLANIVDAMAAGAMIFKNLVVGISEAIGNSIATGYSVFGDLIKGRFRKAAESMKTGIDANLKIVVDRKRQVLEEVGEIVEAREVSRQNDKIAAAAAKNTERFAKTVKLKSKQEKEFNKTRESLAEGQAIQQEAVLNTQVKSTEKILTSFSQMQASKSAALLAVGKVAALGIIAINTAEAIRNTFAWFSGFFLIGAFLATIAVIAIIAFAAEQVANVLGAKMAQGGMVMGGELTTPIPDNIKIAQTVNVRINGGLSGTDAEAQIIAQIIHSEVA